MTDGSIGPDGFTRLAENIANDAALVRMSQAEGWDAAVQEAEDRGLLCDAFADEIRGRNPYRDSSSNRTSPERWQVRHVESGAVVPCRDQAEAEAHVRESVSGPWVAEVVISPGSSSGGDPR